MPAGWCAMHVTRRRACHAECPLRRRDANALERNGSIGVERPSSRALICSQAAVPCLSPESLYARMAYEGLGACAGRTPMQNF